MYNRAKRQVCRSIKSVEIRPITLGSLTTSAISSYAGAWNAVTSFRATLERASALLIHACLSPISRCTVSGRVCKGLLKSEQSDIYIYIYTAAHFQKEQSESPAPARRGDARGFELRTHRKTPACLVSSNAGDFEQRILMSRARIRACITAG